MTAEEAICEIAKDARDDQRHGSAAEFAWEHVCPRAPDEEGQRTQRDEGEGVVRILRAIEHAKGHAGVRGLVQPEGAFDHLILSPMQVEVRHDPALRPLIENVERQGEKEKELGHAGRAFMHPSRCLAM